MEESFIREILAFAIDPTCNEISFIRSNVSFFLLFIFFVVIILNCFFKKDGQNIIDLFSFYKGNILKIFLTILMLLNAFIFYYWIKDSSNQKQVIYVGKIDEKETIRKLVINNLKDEKYFKLKKTNAEFNQTSDGENAGECLEKCNSNLVIWGEPPVGEGDGLVILHTMLKSSCPMLLKNNEKYDLEIILDRNNHTNLNEALLKQKELLFIYGLLIKSNVGCRVRKLTEAEEDRVNNFFNLAVSDSRLKENYELLSILLINHYLKTSSIDKAIVSYSSFLKKNDMGKSKFSYVQDLFENKIMDNNRLAQQKLVAFVENVQEKQELKNIITLLAGINGRDSNYLGLGATDNMYRIRMGASYDNQKVDNKWYPAQLGNIAYGEASTVGKYGTKIEENVASEFVDFDHSLETKKSYEKLKKENKTPEQLEVFCKLEKRLKIQSASKECSKNFKKLIKK